MTSGMNYSGISSFIIFLAGISYCVYFYKMCSYDELNKDYSPKFWSKRLTVNEILDSHLSFAYSVSESVRSEVPFVKDVKYGEKSSNLLDIYGTDLEKDAPVFVYVHGGYWHILSKNDCSYMVKPLWKAGIRTYVPDYDLVPEATLEEIVEDAKMMAKYVLKVASENNASGVWFGGHSAGAHLSACLLDEAWLTSLPTNSRNIFKGLILISGLFDLLPLLRTEKNEFLNLTESSAISVSPYYYNNLSNIIENSLLNEDFKILVTVAADESPAFINQSFIYYEKLKENNFNVLYRPMIGRDHFDIVENLSDENYTLSQDIISYILG